ncbi:MAG TPA: cob(I)yrinic acid a,c-diamide adenosyltransferase [Anaerolineae bacterium]|nr:cob(I)yrinic acid a,c-diamide adenosyltransferase [Anaerolineae bacterium]
MSRFYSGRGDDGRTQLLGPERVPKYDPRPEAYGAVDEAQAVMGLARALGCSPAADEALRTAQRDLSALMAELAAAGQGDSPFTGRIGPEQVAWLEAQIAALEAGLEMPKRFVVPGDSRVGAALHLARTVVRRAERRAVRLADEGLLTNRQVLVYLNRLSSLLFVLALVEDRAAENR